MLREAAELIAKDVGLPVAFPDFTRRKLAQSLTAEFQSGACHAGQFEGSLILASRPELVDDDVRMSLPDNPTSLVAAFGRGAKTFEEAGGPKAYFGSPKGANADEGVATFEKLSDMLVEAILALM